MLFCKIHKKNVPHYRGRCIFCYRNEKFQSELNEINRRKLLQRFTLDVKRIKYIDNLPMSAEKRDALKTEYRKVCEDIYIEREHKCEACGLPGSNMDFSHVIRRSKNSLLIADPRNIRLHCRNCHNKWDSGNISKMMECRDFEENINYIYEKERSAFGLLSIKADEIGVNIFKMLNYCKKEDFKYLK